MEFSSQIGTNKLRKRGTTVSHTRFKGVAGFDFEGWLIQQGAEPIDEQNPSPKRRISFTKRSFRGWIA